MADTVIGCAHCGQPVGETVYACSECRDQRICPACARETGLLGVSLAWDDRQAAIKAAASRAKARAQSWATLRQSFKKGATGAELRDFVLNLGKRK